MAGLDIPAPGSRRLNPRNTPQLLLHLVGSRPVAARDERLRQHDIRVATAPHLQSLTAAHGDDLHAITGLPLEQRNEGIEQPGIPRGGCGGEDDVARLARRCGGTDECGDPNPESPASHLPTHLHLDHAPVVLELDGLLAEDLVVAQQLEVVATDEVLHAEQVTGGAVRGDLIARVELLHAPDELNALRCGAERCERVPTRGADVGSAVSLADVLRARGPALSFVDHLAIHTRAVAVALEC